MWPDRLIPDPVHELEDADVGRILAHGAALGVPLAYVISLLVVLPGAGWPLALWIGAWPALVAGPWVGGVVFLLKRLGELEARPHIIAVSAATPTPKAALGNAA
jgi:hypothetical protein